MTQEYPFEVADCRGSFSRWASSIKMAEQGLIRRHCRGVLLDVGSNCDLVIAGLGTMGYQVDACDLNAELLASRRDLYRRVFPGDFLSVGIDGTYDGIVMFRFLEHVAAPVAVLARARALMHPGSRLFVIVPSIHLQLIKRALGFRVEFQANMHLQHFTPVSLEGCAARAGLRVIEYGFIEEPLRLVCQSFLTWEYLRVLYWVRWMIWRVSPRWNLNSSIVAVLGCSN